MANKVFAVIDTNVLVSALISKNPDSFPLMVIANVFNGNIIPVFNDEILSEYKDVLSRNKKFHLDKSDIDEAMRVFEEYGLYSDRTKVDDEFFPDEKDIAFYEVTMSKDDTYLVTGNIKHFPKKPFIVTPKEMMKILQVLEIV